MCIIRCIACNVKPENRKTLYPFCIISDGFCIIIHNGTAMSRNFQTRMHRERFHEILKNHKAKVDPTQYLGSRSSGKTQKLHVLKGVDYADTLCLKNSTIMMSIIPTPCEKLSPQPMLRREPQQEPSQEPQQQVQSLSWRDTRPHTPCLSRCGGRPQQYSRRKSGDWHTIHSRLCGLSSCIPT